MNANGDPAEDPFCRSSCVMPLPAAFARIGDGKAVSWLG